MKIQVIKKATPRAGADCVCPWFVDVPMAHPKRARSFLHRSGAKGWAGR